MYSFRGINHCQEETEQSRSDENEAIESFSSLSLSKIQKECETDNGGYNIAKNLSRPEEFLGGCGGIEENKRLSITSQRRKSSRSSSSSIVGYDRPDSWFVGSADGGNDDCSSVASSYSTLTSSNRRKSWRVKSIRSIDNDDISGNHDSSTGINMIDEEEEKEATTLLRSSSNASVISSSSTVGYNRPDCWIGNEERLKPRRSWRVKKNNDVDEQKEETTESTLLRSSSNASVVSSSSTIGYNRPDCWIGDEKRVKPRRSWSVKIKSDDDDEKEVTAASALFPSSSDASVVSSSSTIGYNRPDRWVGSEKYGKPRRSWRVKKKTTAATSSSNITSNSSETIRRRKSGSVESAGKIIDDYVDGDDDDNSEIEILEQDKSASRSNDNDDDKNGLNDSIGDFLSFNAADSRASRRRSITFNDMTSSIHSALTCDLGSINEFNYNLHEDVDEEDEDESDSGHNHANINKRDVSSKTATSAAAASGNSSFANAMSMWQSMSSVNTETTANGNSTVAVGKVYNSNLQKNNGRRNSTVKRSESVRNSNNIDNDDNAEDSSRRPDGWFNDSSSIASTAMTTASLSSLHGTKQRSYRIKKIVPIKTTNDKRENEIPNTCSDRCEKCNGSTAHNFETFS